VLPQHSGHASADWFLRPIHPKFEIAHEENAMPQKPTRIQSVEMLQHYLYLAMQLEHATIPPYLMALYSIYPGTNFDASQVLRVVVVEEMLHLTLAANIMNAVGGKVDLTTPGFVPNYPSALPDGEKDFEVHLRPFSCEAFKTFEMIERVGPGVPENQRIRTRSRAANALAYVPGDDKLSFWSIGEFYEEIIRGLNHLYGELGDKLFSGDPAWQVTSEYFYSGGGEIIPVTDIDSARKAATLIIEQGEGLGGGIYNQGHELAHYYRFQQLLLGKFYLKGDSSDAPTGPALAVDWNAAFRFSEDPKVSQYPPDSEVYTAAVEFNQRYGEFLAMLTAAYQGKPKLLLEAVPYMFSLRNLILRLLHNPFPGKPEFQAAPTFEVNPA
jgi:Ferritin-like